MIRVFKSVTILTIASSIIFARNINKTDISHQRSEA